MMDGMAHIPPIAALLGAVEPQPARTLHAHPDVVLWLKISLPEAEAEPPGIPGIPDIAALTATPVIRDQDLERGAWELRDGDRVVTSGHVDLPSWIREIQLAPIPFPDLSAHYDTDWQLRRRMLALAPLPPPAIGLSSVI